MEAFRRPSWRSPDVVKRVQAWRDCVNALDKLRHMVADMDTTAVTVEELETLRSEIGRIGVPARWVVMDPSPIYRKK